MAASPYNKLVIFDLDGVLIDSRHIHETALNNALEAVGVEPISREEHLARYDGLPTSKKLAMLTEFKGLPVDKHQEVWQRKQDETIRLFNEIDSSPKLNAIFFKLWREGYKIAVASNSIRNTVKIALLQLGIMEFVDYYVSNEDVMKNKPYPSMYWRCMEALNAIPGTTLIIEDSHIGRRGALDSGARLLAVENPDDVTYDKVQEALAVMGNTRPKVKWIDKKMNVLIPMAGAGSRFAAAGYTFPKPLIEVRGKPMIQVVVDNLDIDAHFIFIVRTEDYEKYHLSYLLNMIAPGCDIVQCSGLTEGAACTTLLAKELIDNDSPLLIANSDQFVEWNANEVLYAFKADQIDGGIVSFKSTHPKWSYAKVDINGFVSEVAEKKVISDNATVGIYYWKQGRDYVWWARHMIEKNIRTNGEFYVAPVFNEVIQAGGKVRLKQIERMWGIGVPEDLDYFLANYKGQV